MPPATEDVSPAATKKAKSVKTPAKSKNTEEPAKDEVEPTPKPKKGKTPVKAPAKTPVKASETEEPVQTEAEKTPATKSKKDKTPAKPAVTEEAANTPATKSKKDKTPAKPAETEEAVKTPASKSKKNKTPAKPKNTEEAAPEEIAPKETAPEETEKTPASKSKKVKTPAKAKLAKETPSKTVEKPTPKTTEKTLVETKDTPKVVSKAVQQTPVSKPKVEKTPKKTPKSALKKSAKKAEPEPVPVEQEDDAAEAAEEVAGPEEDENMFSEEELDEQTKALIQTVDIGDEDEPDSGIVLFEQGQDVGLIPADSKKEKKAAKKALAAAKYKAKNKEDTGVIYVGRLPHGFYEHEMKSYFGQFGPIRNLRVSRNKKTGKAKHFGFIEFEELSTAEIVAKTMDNYLLFGHILKCSVIPKAQVNDDLFKGANKRFKVCCPHSHVLLLGADTNVCVQPVPWNKMESKSMDRPMLEDKWARKINKENKRRAERAKRLEAVGYEFSAPEAKGLDAAKALTSSEEVAEAVEEPTTKAIEATPVVEAVEVEDGEEEQEAILEPVKRGRGRPAKTPQKNATETPRKTSRRTKV